jgi:hypothetical protein
MIRSLNVGVMDDALDVMIEDLDERSELVCVLNACALHADLCAGHVCLVGCFGIHVW